MSDLTGVILILYRARHGAPTRSVHFFGLMVLYFQLTVGTGLTSHSLFTRKMQVFKARSVWLLAAELLLSSWFPRNLSSEISHKLVACWTKSRKNRALSARIWRVERQQNHSTVVRTASQDGYRCLQICLLCVSVSLSVALWSYIRIHRLWLKF